jgi:hypothetical protein
MAKSPVAIPFSTDGVEIQVKDATVVPTDARGFLGVGLDGATTRFFRVDISGRQIFVGAGVAGTPAGGVLSVQGVAGGTALPVSLASVPLPTGAATEATLVTRATETTLGTRLAEATFTGRINTLGQKAMAASTPIVIASDQTAVSVRGTDAEGVAPTQNPVLIAGTDGTNVRRVLTDTTGRPQVVGGAASGVAPSGNPVLIAGQDGTNVRSIKTDISGRIEFSPAGATAVVKGFSDGSVVLAALTIVPVRGTTYTEPSVGAQRSLASNNANDTAAGTGARTVRITYYTLTAGVVAGPFTETVTLNGVANVNTVATNICFIERLEVLTVGSTGSNVGVISLFGAAGGGGGTVWTIAATLNKTFGAHHYVPSGVTCNITSFIGGIRGADAAGFILRARNPANANAAELQVSDLIRAPLTGSTPLRKYATPIQVVGPSRITAFAVPDSTSSRTYYASFDFYEQ